MLESTGLRDDGIFAEVIEGPLRVVIFGAAEAAEHLCAYGKQLGWRTTVVDARPALATPRAHPERGRGDQGLARRGRRPHRRAHRRRHALATRSGSTFRPSPRRSSGTPATSARSAPSARRSAAARRSPSRASPRPTSTGSTARPASTSAAARRRRSRSRSRPRSSRSPRAAGRRTRPPSQPSDPRRQTPSAQDGRVPSVTVTVCVLAVADVGDADLVARLLAVDHAREVAAVRDRLAVELRDHVAGLQARLGGRRRRR